MENSNCIIITQKEWLNWLAFGYLRISTPAYRISYFDQTESSFDKLMSHSVDNALDEEDAYLIASLVNDYSRKELHVKRTLFSDYISIQAVQGFYSLSIKGRDLLEYEMEQSHSILHCDSKIENLWSEWKNNQLKLRSNDKGNKFLEILGYPRFEVEPKLDDGTLFSELLKNYNRRNLHPRLQDRHKRSSFAWLVINQEFKEKIGKDLYLKYYEFRQSNQNLEIQDIAKTYKFLEDSFITNDSDSLFDYPLLIAEKSFFDKWHSDNSEPKEHYLASTILVHYYNILESNYDINLLSLSKDLTLLDKIDSPEDISQLIAYFIGRRLNEVYLNSLYIAKNIDEKKPSMFNPNFFSNKKKEKLTLFHSDPDQLQDTINKVKLIAEEIQLAYNEEVNNVQNSEIESDPIADRDISETNNNPTENLYTTGNTTNDDSTQPHSEAQNSVDSEESEDSTNSIATKNEDFNEDNNNPKLSSHTQLNPPDKEHQIDSSEDSLDKPEAIEAITEQQTDSKPDNSHSARPDYYNIAVSLHLRLTEKEKNSGKNFIDQFISSVDNVAIKKKLKQKQKKSQKDFFRLFGDLIGDKDSYEDMNYTRFKAKLDLNQKSELF